MLFFLKVSTLILMVQMSHPLPLNTGAMKEVLNAINQVWPRVAHDSLSMHDASTII